MNGCKKLIFTLLAVCFILSLSVNALLSQAKQPQAKTTAEYNAYSALYKEQDPAKKAEMATKYMTDFPDSDFKPYIYQTLIDSYFRLSNKEKVIEVGEKFNADMPQADPSVKKFMLQRLMQIYQASNNFDKTVECGEKLLELDPNDLPALLTLCAVLPERLPPASEETKRNEQLSKALDYSQRALAQVDTIIKQPKPAPLTDEQWNAERNRLLATVNSSLALVYLNKRDYPKAAEVYETAVSLVKTNPIDWFRLGLAYSMQARARAVEMNDLVKSLQAGQQPAAGAPTIDDLKKKFEEFREKAMGALSKSVFLKGATEPQARTELEKLYKTKNNDKLDGLEEVIAKAGEELK
jgi:tetratricopeptide (TPR) repeat protein